MRAIVTVFGFGFLFFFSGCASIMTGTGGTQQVTFASTPRGASVYVDDGYVGTTPIIANLARNYGHNVSIDLAGYVPYKTTIGSGFNPWVLGNIVFGFGGPIGVVVDLATGATTSLSPTDVYAYLRSNQTRSDRDLHNKFSLHNKFKKVNADVDTVVTRY